MDEDRNSKYFHKKASSRRRKNKILKLQDANGEWMEDNQLDEYIIDHFQSIFSASSQEGLMEFIESLESRVTDTMNEDLSKEFTMEIFSTLQQMQSTKAPNLDGMPPIFFLKYWHIVEKSITYAFSMC